MESADLDSIASKAGDLPSLPTIALKVMEMVGDPNATATDLQHVIMSDQAMAARVLKIANSALFATRSTITTISHAVVVLGFSTLRSVVLASSVQRSFSDSPGRRGGLADASMWEHALAVAIATREIARGTGVMPTEEAFVSGLLHDIGKLVLSKNLTQPYGEVLSDVVAGLSTFVDAETRLLGFNHTHVGALVARKWKLPDSVANAILFHHNPRMAPAETNHCAAVCLANEIAVTANIGIEKRVEGDWAEFEAVKMLGLSAAGVQELKSKTLQVFSEEKQALLG